MGVKARMKGVIAPDRSLCLLCAWILVKAISLHSYTTAFDAPRDSMAYITSPLFQLGSSAGILVSSAVVLFLVFKSSITRFSLPIFIPAMVLAITHTCSAFGIYQLLTTEGVFLVVGVVWGICTNLLSLSLVELLAEERSPATIALYLAMGSLAAAAVSSTLQDVSSVWAAMICALLLLCAGWLIAFCRKSHLGEANSGILHDGAQDLYASAPVDRKNLFGCLSENLPILLAFFVSEAVVGMLNMFSYANVDALPISTMLPISGMTICAMAFLVVIAMTSSAPNSSMMFSFVIPAVIAVLLLLPFIGDSHGPALSTALSASYHFVAITAVYCYVRSCKSHGVSLYAFAAIVCGAERIVLLLGLGIGLLLGNAIEGDFFMRVTALAVVSAYALGILVFAFGVARRRSGEAAAPANEAPIMFEDLDVGFSSEVKAENGQPLPVEEKNAADVLSDEYGLTARETDVLRLLARGRDVAFIGETLHLSRNTVQGYVKALYSKLGVHSRRELHDLLDASEGR